MNANCESINVCKTYAGKPALEDVSLQINGGEIVALLGHNGAGKTTLINSLLGQIKLDAGQCLVNGEDAASRTVRTHRAAMLQVSNVPDTLTIQEHIQLFQAYYPQPMPLPDVLSLAGLTDMAQRRSKNLSGGEKQRLMFALAICGNANILFLDEPSVGMDIQSRRRMWQAITDLKNQGKAILLTTHYLEEAELLANRIAIIHGGKIIKQGTPDEIKQVSNGGEIQCRTQLSIDQLQRLPGVIKVAHQDRRMNLTCEHLNHALSALLQQDFNLSHLTASGATLEQALLAITDNA